MLSGSIAGLIVAETKELGQLAKEDRTLLANCFRGPTSKVCYILSLGVSQQVRKQGIASLLLEQLIAHLTSDPASPVRALYLNGGHPSWGALDYVKLAGLALCSLSPHRALA